MKKYDIGTVAAIAILVVFIAGIVGWVMNLADLVGMFGASIDAEFVLQLVGLFVAPLGAVLGYF